MVHTADVIEDIDTAAEQIETILRRHGYLPIVKRPALGAILYLDEFRNDIASGEYAIFVANTHAGNVGIAVEIYDDKDVRDGAYAYYLEHGYDDSLIAKFDEQLPNHGFIIAVRPKAIEQWSRFKKGTIAWVLTCYSYPRLNEAFINAGVSVFVGNNVDSWFPDMRMFSLGFWGLLGGMGPLDGSALPPTHLKRNYTVGDAFSAVDTLDDYFGVPHPLAARAADGSCVAERLFNPPRIISAKLTQSDIYDWTYADTSYPFNEGAYPGDRSAAAKNPAKAGQLQAVLRFSEGMDPSWSGFKVQLDPQGVGAGADAVDFSGSWSKNLFDNDTWTGTATIPGSGEGWEGQAAVVVKAHDAFQDDDSSQNIDGELDTDGDGAANGADTSVGFTTPSPVFLVGRRGAVVCQACA